MEDMAQQDFYLCKLSKNHDNLLIYLPKKAVRIMGLGRGEKMLLMVDPLKDRLILRRLKADPEELEAWASGSAKEAGGPPHVG